MEYFAGLDVGVKETAICVVNSAGAVVLEASAETTADAIHQALEGYAGRLRRVGHEAGALSPWLHRGLQRLGLEVVLLETRHVHAALKAQRNKTDRNDARGIAQMMRLGWYRAVHVKSLEMQKLRTLLSNRRLLKRKLIDMENHIRGTLRVYGLRVGRIGRGGFDARIRELIADMDYVFEAMVLTMLETRQAVLEGYNRLHKVLLRVVANDPLCRRFMTIPGVGPVAALSFKVAVDDPQRFPRSRTVGAHFGQTPRRYQSGTSVDYDGKITKQGDVNVRGALCEAAASLLMRVHSWSALKAWGMRIVKRTSMMCAIVAIARKLASILHRMWIDGSEFRYTAGAAITEKVKLKPAH